MGALLDCRHLVAEARKKCPVKRRRSHPLPGQCAAWTIANHLFSSRNFPSREPFEFVAELATVDPQDIFGSIRGLSEARYQRDLYRVFSEVAPSPNERLAAMHKTWFEVSYTVGTLPCHAQVFDRMVLGTRDLPSTCSKLW